MSKKVQKTLTGAMAAMMATGVVATPAMAATTNKTQADVLYRAAYEATMKAESEKTQSAVNEARAAIKALKEYAPKLVSAIGTFSSKVDAVQGPILRNILKLIDTAKAEPTQENINNAKAAITADLPATWRNPYSSAVDKIQVELQNKAKEAVKKAQETRKVEDIEAAKKLVAEIGTSNSQAFKDWAAVRMAQLDAIKIYDLELTKATLSADGSGVTVEFKALEEALRNVTLEVIDNNGNVVEVKAKTVLIEGETTAKFEFKTEYTSDLEGIWKINGFEINQDKINLVNYVNGYDYIENDAKSVQGLFDLLKESNLVTGLVDKLVNHKQYFKEFSAQKGKIETVEDIQKIIDSANKNVGTEVKATDLIKLAKEGTLSEFTALVEKANFERVNNAWIQDYKIALATDENGISTISGIQDLIDSTNKAVAVNVFNSNFNLVYNTNKNVNSVENNLTVNGKLSVYKIEAQLGYVEEYVVVKADDKQGAENKAHMIQQLKELLAIQGVSVADTQTSMKAALTKLANTIDNKEVFDYSKLVNENILAFYVNSNDVTANTLSDVKDILDLGYGRAYRNGMKDIQDAADAINKVDDAKKVTEAQKNAFIKALKNMANVTVNNVDEKVGNKVTVYNKFDYSLVDEALVVAYANRIPAGQYYLVTDEGTRTASIHLLVNDIKAGNSSVLEQILKTATTADTLLKALKDAGVNNVIDANKATYFAELDPVTNGDAFTKLTLVKLQDEIDAINSFVVVNTSSDINAVKNALTTIAVLKGDFQTVKEDGKLYSYVNLSNNQKLDVAEVTIADIAESGIKIASLNNVSEYVTTTAREAVDTLLDGVNNEAAIDDAVILKAGLEAASKEYDALGAVAKIEVAQAFNANRPYTTDKDGKFVAYKPFTNLTDVRTLLAKVMK